VKTNLYKVMLLLRFVSWDFVSDLSFVFSLSQLTEKPICKR